MHIEFNRNLKSQNTFGMDVSCACHVEYDSAEDLAGFFSEGKQFELPQPFLQRCIGEKKRRGPVCLQIG